MSVTLEDVYTADNSFLDQLLATQNVSPIADPKLKRLTASIIYYNLGYLTPEDMKIVEKPDFNQRYLAAENIPTLLQELREPSSEDKDVTVEEVSNAALSDILAELGAFYQLSADTYRSKAFSSAASIVKDFPTIITDISQVKAVKGIGKSIIEVIEDYLKTGQSTRLETIRRENRETTEVLKLFTSVYGIGPIAAAKYYSEGARSLEDLGRLKLTDAQKLGLTYYYHLKERIPRSEIDEYAQALKPLFEGLRWEIVGSYRRGEMTSGDIDVIVENTPATPINLSTLVNRIEQAGLLIGTLASGPRKFMGIVHLPRNNADSRIARRLDIRLFQPDTWAFSLIYNTGSKQFNVLTRQHALELGLTMNEYEMKSLDGRYIYPANTEEDIFNYLRLKYLPPKDRTKDLTSLE